MTSVFAGRLVEPSLDVTLPVFVEMPVRDHIITTRGHLDEFCLITYILEQGKKTGRLDLHVWGRSGGTNEKTQQHQRNGLNNVDGRRV